MVVSQPWGLTGWAVKTLMSYEVGGGTVDQSGLVGFSPTPLRVPRSNPNPYPNMFLDEKP